MKIKQVEELVGITRKNIRFYEEQGLLQVARADNGYREYHMPIKLAGCSRFGCCASCRFRWKIFGHCLPERFGWIPASHGRPCSTRGKSATLTR